MSEKHEHDLDEQDGPVNIVTDPVDAMRCEKCDTQIDVSALDAFTPIECPHCGHQGQVPARLGDFLLLRLLGMGGMGGVFYARDETLGRFVAIKVMLKSLGDDASFVDTFKREAQAVAKLNHTNIAQIYTFGQEKGQPYIVMELIKGKHLDTMIEDDSPLSEFFVLRVIMEVAEGLAAADDIGLIHGDIKPENILLDEKGNSKLVDFGLATFVDQQVQDGIWGTPYYIAPEKVRRHHTDARADIYSLGATMFHALTGRPPFEGDTPVEVVKGRLNTVAPAVSSLRTDVDSDVERITARMLDEDPGRRYPTYASLIGDIKKTLERLGPDKAPPLRGKKVMIRKKGSKGGAGNSTTTLDTPSSGKIVVSRGRSDNIQARASTPPASPDTASDTEPNETPKKRSKATLLMLLIVLFMAMIGTGVYWGIHAAKQRATAAQLAVQQAALNALHAQGTTLCEEADAAIGTLTEIQKAAIKIYDTAAVNVHAVEDTPLPPPQTPVVSEPEAEAAPLAAEPAQTNEAASATNALPAATNALAEAAAPAADASDSLIMTMGQRVVEACETIMGLHAEATGLVDKATSINDTLQESTASATATARLAQLERLHRKLPILIGDARSALDQARAAAEETAALRKQEEKKRERARKAAARAAHEAAERKAAERAAAAKQARIDAELQRVKRAEAGVGGDVSSYRFADAARTLKLAARDFETEEGQAAIANAIERYQRLAGMKQYFIDRLSKAPLTWGYVDGPSRLDILSANVVGLRIKTGLVPWREVSPRQMVELIKTLIREDALSKGVKLRELAHQNVNAAIFCALNGWHRPAKIYGDAAVTLLSTMQDDVARLVPPPSPPEDAEE